MNNILWLVVGFSVAATAHAAGFDCAKASTNMERMICGNDKLSRLDDELSKTYQRALDQSTDKNGLKKEQRQWLSDVRNSCKDEGCILAAYNTRLEELNRHLSSGDVAAREFGQDERGKLVIGKWVASSRAFFGYDLEITDKTITLGECHSASYSIIKIKDGTGPTGIETWLKGKWHEVAIEVKPTGSQAACKAYRALDFIIAEEKKCSAGIYVYESADSFKREGYDGWGQWYKPECANN